MSETKKLIEAALFMAPRSLNFSYLKKTAGMDSKEKLLGLLRELKHDYNNRDSAMEIFINLDEEKAMMRVRPDYLDRVKDLATNTEFHEGIQKTLALIAFKQPVKQADVVRYRNVKAYEHIKVLEDKGFIRRIPAGRTFVLLTTKKFSEYFNIDIAKKQMLQKTDANPLQDISPEDAQQKH